VGNYIGLSHFNW